MERLIAGARGLGLHLTPEQIESFEVYYRELVDWNKRINLTSIVNYEDVQVKHFLDSLSVTLALNSKQAMQQSLFSTLDVGSGAGLPGIPLKILYPEIRLTLLDSIAKKTRFLYHLINRLGLDGVEVLTGRAEELAHKPGCRERFHLVLSRAVATLPSLSELTLPFCSLGGIFVAQKKGQINEEVERAKRAITTLGGRLREVKRVKLDEFIEERLLVIIDKVAPTPNRYPRRSGIPEKRPL